MRRENGCPMVVWAGAGQSATLRALMTAAEAQGLVSTRVESAIELSDCLRACPDMLAVVVCRSLPWLDHDQVVKSRGGVVSQPLLVWLGAVIDAGGKPGDAPPPASPPAGNDALRLSGTVDEIVASLRFVCNSYARDRHHQAILSLTDDTLDQLDRQLQAISRQVAAFSPLGDRFRPSHAQPDPRLFAELLRHIRINETRKRLFPQSLFADPAWSMLLDLVQNRMVGRSAYVSSLAVGAGVALTTALRHLATLERLGLAARTPDMTDRRRTLVELTDDGYQRMCRFLEATLHVDQI